MEHPVYMHPNFAMLYCRNSLLACKRTFFRSSMPRSIDNSRNMRKPALGHPSIKRNTSVAVDGSQKGARSSSRVVVVEALCYRGADIGRRRGAAVAVAGLDGLSHVEDSRQDDGGHRTHRPIAIFTLLYLNFERTEDKSFNHASGCHTWIC
jgi:hypothetical protein